MLLNMSFRTLAYIHYLFGVLDVNHIPALGYMEVVDQRDTATLLPINSNILPG